MSIGGGNTVSFGIKAIADLKGINDTSKALADLSAKGKTSGQGIAAGMDAATSKMEAARAKADALKGSLSKISTTGFLVGGAIAGGLGLAVKTFADFQHEMNAVQAVTGATGDEFKQLSSLALQIGRDTVFSSSEAASAIEELAKAGVSTKDILEGAAAGATALAAAAGEGIPEAAVQIANALNEFGLAGDQATHVADVFANVSAKSAADATSFGEALTYVGGQAHALGVPLEDVGAAISVLADQGIQGSLAGTSLGDAMIRLIKPTAAAKDLMAQHGIVIKDAAGNFVGLTAVINEVAKATENMGNVEKQEFLTKVFGIQGARAINALLNTQTAEAKAAGKSWQDYESAVNKSGTAQNQAAARMQGLTGAFKQLGGSFELAQIQIGGKLAPAIEAVANGLTGLLNAFSGLSSSTQSVVAFGLAGVAAFALVVAAGAKAINIGVSTVETWGRVADAFRGSAAASEVAAAGVETEGAAAATAAVEVEALAVAEGGATVAAGEMGAASAASAGGIGAMASAMGGFALALAPVAAGLVAVKLGMDDLNAIQSGGTPGLVGTAESIGISASHGIAAVIGTIPWGKDIADSINKSADDRAIGDALQNVLKSAGFHLDTNFGLKGGLDVDIKELGITVGQFREQQQKSGLSVDDYIKKLQSQAKATQEATSATKDGTAASDDAAAATADQAVALQIQADAAVKAKDDQDLLNKTVQETLNQRFLAGASAEGLYLPFTRGADDAAKATADFNKSLDGIVNGALNAERGLQDVAPGLDGLQTGFSKVGESVVDVFRHIDDLGVINLSPMARGALDAISTLDKVQAKIEGVDKAIQQNQGDMSMWAGRISLVEDVFGASSETIGEWQKELENGQITQEQFNAAIGTLAGSGGFPKLDAPYQQGKISQEQYNEAIDAGTFLLQRSAGGMQDEDAQLVQNVIDLANYAKAHDDADGAVNGLSDSQREFVAAMGDSKTQTFLQTLQLLTYLAVVGQIPKEAVTKFIADSSDADPVLKGVIDDLGLIPKDKTTNINADATGYDNTTTDIANQKLPDKEVKIVGVSAIAATTGAGFAPFPDATVANPPPVELTADDQITPVVQTVSATLTQFSADAGAAGAAAGTNFSNSFASGLSGGVNAAVVTAGAVVAALDIGGSLASMGEADGQNFGIGIANGIAATWNDVFNAAYYVAGAAHAGTQAGMDAHSPSKLAIKSGVNWGQSVAMGIRSTAADVLSAGKAVSAALSGAITAPDLSTSMRSVLSSASRPQGDILAAASGRGASVTHHQTINVGGISVNGAGDPDAVATRVVTEIYRSFDRGQAAGLFGN